MTHTACEMTWLKTQMFDLGFNHLEPMEMHCHNQTTIHITSNPVFHERTKHIEVDCYFIRDAVMSNKISTPFTSFKDQLVDMFTKALGSPWFLLFCNKLVMY